ncbi:unnamed protein product, partial [Hymenolepis diminuta]
FWSPFKLPDQFLSLSNDSLWLNPVNHVNRPPSHIQNLQALPTRPVFNPIFFTMMLSKNASSSFMVTLFWPFKEEKIFTILQSGKESVVSMDRVKPFYLDKLVTKNVTSMFSQIKETDKPMPVKVCTFPRSLQNINKVIYCAFPSHSYFSLTLNYLRFITFKQSFCFKFSCIPFSIDYSYDTD